MNKIKDIITDHSAFLTKQSRRIRNESSECNCSNIRRVFQWLRTANNKWIVKAIHAPFRFRHQKTMPMFVSWKKGAPGNWRNAREQERKKERKRKRERETKKEKKMWPAIDAAVCVERETSLFASSLLLALIIHFFHLSAVNCLRSQFSKGFRSTPFPSPLFLSLVFTSITRRIWHSDYYCTTRRRGVENKQISASNAFSLALLHRLAPK